MRRCQLTFYKKLLFLLLCSYCAGVLASESVRPFAIEMGEPLRKVLDRFTEVGLNVVSTTRLVPSRMVVTAVPDADLPPMEQLDQLLRPHNLQLVSVDPNNSYVERIKTPAEAVNPAPEAAVRRASFMEEVVVTSPYRVRRERELAASLDHEDLLTLPSLGRDVLRGIDILPGVATNGISARYQFRGGDNNEVLYRLDGIELLEPFHLPSVQDLFGAVNINIIDSADIYVAGFPVDLGSRMSGVVDLELVEPTAKFSGGVDLNFITASTDARGWAGNWNWVVSARRSLIDKAIGQFETDYGTPRFQDELLHLTRSTGETTFTLGAVNSRDRVVVRQDTQVSRSNDDFRALWMRWQQDHQGQLSSTWQFSTVNIDKTRWGRVDDSMASVGALEEQREFNTYELSNHWEWQRGSTSQWRAGWSFARQKADFEAEFAADYGPLALPGLRGSTLQRDVEVDRSGDSSQAFISYIRAFGSGWRIETGLRYDGQDIDPVHVSEFSARVNVDYKLSEAWRFALNVGRYTQQQHLYEIQIDDGRAELFNPQHSDQINLSGIYAPNDKLRVRLDLYLRQIGNPWSHFENLYNTWVLIPELQGDRFEIETSKARMRGAELSLSYKVSETLSWYINATRASAEETTLSREVARPWDQELAVKAGLSWQSARWRLGLKGSYHSGLPTTEFVTTDDQLTGSLYGSRLPSFFTIDAHVSRMIAVPRGSLEVYLDVTNLTDRSNVGGYEYSSATERDAQEMLPLLPVLGVSWRW